MNFSRTKRSSFKIFDMTPMIDVVFQLIIFFMYTSSFSQLARTPIDLPQEVGDEIEHLAPETITVDLNAQGQMLVEGEVLTLDELARLVQFELDGTSGSPDAFGVLIRPDQNLPSRLVNQIADRLTAMGVRRWKVATSVPPGGTP